MDVDISLSRPVVLLGRGGSGTRLLSDLALSLKVFLGNKISESGDSLEWVDALYDLTLETLGAKGPLEINRRAYWRDRLRRLAREILEKAGRTPSGPWGWKLPETMLTLDCVLEAFPNARIIHLVRHPLTSSLRRSHLTSREDNPIGKVALPAAYRACGFDPGRITDHEVFMHNAISWTFQVNSVLRILREKGLIACQISYEALCADSRQVQAMLADFLDLEVPADAGLQKIDSARAENLLSADIPIDDIWAICGEVAEQLGYQKTSPERIGSGSSTLFAQLNARH